MPSLIYEHSGLRRGGVIDGRVLIGRRLTHGVVIDDPAVSRLHAWIQRFNGAFVLNDAGSRSGTFVNGLAVARCELKDGDEIRVGPANLVFRIDERFPDDVAVVELSARGATVLSSRSGQMVDCDCGAPLWLGEKQTAKYVRCTHCGRKVPTPASATAGRSRSLKNNGHARPMRASAKCGVCHTLIGDGEETSRCDECGTTFHLDCWQENYGCSSYGCKQVNALKPVEVAADLAAATVLDTQTTPATPTGAPWDSLLLAGSVLASIIGALLFGIPSAVVGLASIARAVTGRSPRRGFMAAAVAISVVGLLGGIALSDFWWFAGTHLRSILR